MRRRQACAACAGLAACMVEGASERAVQSAPTTAVRREIVGFAVDTLSLDNGPSRDFPTHHVWLPSGRWGLENVANLDRASPSGAILVVGLPKVKGTTGAPVRLLALMAA
jgi:kynurenine formamidase